MSYHCGSPGGPFSVISGNYGCRLTSYQHTTWWLWTSPTFLRPEGFTYTTYRTLFLISVINLALTRKYFLFNEQFYHQSQGVSTGSSFGPDYANLFVGYLEHCSIFRNNPFQRVHNGTMMTVFFCGGEHYLNLLSSCYISTCPHY